MLAILVDLYDYEALSWSPQAIAMQLHDDFQIDVPQTTIDKIMAGIAILTSDDFYRRCSAFNHICNVLSGDTFDPTIFEPATVDEIAWGITEAVLLSPPEEGEQFSAEICGFIAKTLENEGIVKTPAVLRFAVPASKSDPLAHLADDPEMYQAFAQTQQSNQESVDEALRDRMALLIQELSSLQLRDGNTSDITKKLRDGLTG